jgi:hypothetical protein
MTVDDILLEVHRGGSTGHRRVRALPRFPRRPPGGRRPAAVGTLEPMWNLFDLIPEGRPGDWDEQLSY